VRVGAEEEVPPNEGVRRRSTDISGLRWYVCFSRDVRDEVRYIMPNCIDTLEILSTRLG
jgi:hypothetical protein